MDETIAAAAVALEKVKGDIVTGTLDNLNKPAFGSKKKKSCSAQTAMSDTYDLSKSVLSAAYEAKGIVVNGKS